MADHAVVHDAFRFETGRKQKGQTLALAGETSKSLTPIPLMQHSQQQRPYDILTALPISYNVKFSFTQSDLHLEKLRTPHRNTFATCSNIVQKHAKGKRTGASAYKSRKDLPHAESHSLDGGIQSSHSSCLYLSWGIPSSRTLEGSESIKVRPIGETVTAPNESNYVAMSSICRSDSVFKDLYSPTPPGRLCLATATKWRKDAVLTESEGLEESEPSWSRCCTAPKIARPGSRAIVIGKVRSFSWKPSGIYYIEREDLTGGGEYRAGMMFGVRLAAVTQRDTTRRPKCLNEERRSETLSQLED
ncbi:hypothetical protein DFH09DRAFT_1386555 [Mycena vulgaris]|nr:hypothetical protein DFH09DRAFT_1386555 [Mycena vulgaris]